MTSNKLSGFMLTGLTLLIVCITSMVFVTASLAQVETGPQSPNAGQTIYIPITYGGTASTVLPTSGEWSTLAGNPQRTSWIPEEVEGDIPSGKFHVLWYRPIEAYIPQNVQIIASNNVLYISTARGLYVLDADTGNVKWRFDTELPLGNSPTVQDGIVYVGGYDRKIHALNATNGVHLWAYSGAQAGYSTNPLVINGLVIAGNRDGNMYAIGAQGTAKQGQLVWKYKTGGPIDLSAAYKNGVVYFASNDNYAYALDAATGALRWKSQKLPGDGYQSYWPVVYTDPSTNKDLVILSSASGYRWASSPGANNTESWQDLFNALFQSSDTLGPIVPLGESWANGKTIVNYSRVTEYTENNPSPDPYLHKPWRREYIILNSIDGTEYTFDSDHDGNREYAPILSFATGSGNDYPPVVGEDNLLYFSNLYFSNGQGRVMGWKVGTPYLALTNNQGDTAEPQALSSAGELVFRSICCDRVGDWFNINNPGISGLIWHYGYPLSDIAPGYDQMWWFPSYQLDRLYGNYGDVNGIYHNHGIQNPIVVHQGKYFIHRSNAIIAFGAGQVYGMRPLLTINHVTDAPQPPSVSDLKTRLEAEVSKMIAAGHLRPGYYNAGQFNDIYSDLVDYFNNPGDTLFTLARAYPYLSTTLQQQTQTYLKNEFQSYFDPVMYAQIGWADGAAREAMPLPPEVQIDLKNHPKTTWPGDGWSWNYPQHNIYAMWKYAQIFPADVGRIYDLAKSVLKVPSGVSDQYFAERPFEHNAYIAGYIGFLKLQEMAGKSTVDSSLRTSVTNELNRLQQLRASEFTKDTPYISTVLYTKRTLNVARNFIMLVPELGDYLHANALSKVQAAVDEYNSVGPYWFVSRYNASIAESAMQNLYDYPAMFQAMAYILKEPRDQLTKYLDAPAFERGDLFYIQNLIAAIEAPATAEAASYQTGQPEVDP
jgi:outer membrane protein assembly factor BamB